MFLLFLKSVIIGFSIAMPVGPIGMICIKKTLQNGLKSGIFVGIGAALGDCFYSLISAYGLSYISEEILTYETVIKICGSIFLIYIGLQELKKPWNVKEDKATLSSTTNIKLISKVFLLTIANPATILAFLGVFAAVGSSDIKGFSNILVIISGVFLGSITWWTLLSNSINKIRHKFSTKNIKKINVISGSIIISFGITIIISLLYESF